MPLDRLTPSLPSGSQQKGAFCVWLHSTGSHTFIRQWHSWTVSCRGARGSPGSEPHQPAHTQVLHGASSGPELLHTPWVREWQCFWGRSIPSGLLPRTNWEKRFLTAPEIMKTEAAKLQFSAKFCLLTDPRSQPQRAEKGSQRERTDLLKFIFNNKTAG